MPCILAVLFAFGCSRDLRDVIEELKPKVEPKLAKLAAIREAAKVAPPVTTDAVVVNGPPLRVATYSHDRITNVAIEYLEDLADLQALGNVPFRIPTAGIMNRCAAVLETHREPYNPAFTDVPAESSWYTAEDVLKYCDTARYLFVIRSLAFTLPSPVREFQGICPTLAADAGVSDAGAADGGAADDKCHVFTGGYLRADVLVFDIDSGKQLGGFRYAVENSTQVDVAGASAPEIPIVTDFAVKSRAAFTAAVEKWVPSVTVTN